jgi:hypothetical protein
MAMLRRCCFSAVPMGGSRDFDWSALNPAEQGVQIIRDEGEAVCLGTLGVAVPRIYIARLSASHLGR